METCSYGFFLTAIWGLTQWWQIGILSKRMVLSLMTGDVVPRTGVEYLFGPRRLLRLRVPNWGSIFVSVKYPFYRHSGYSSSPTCVCESSIVFTTQSTGSERAMATLHLIAAITASKDHPARRGAQAKAIASISTGTPLGSSLTATQDRAGLCVKYFSYTEFISAKLSIDVKKTVTWRWSVRYAYFRGVEPTVELSKSRGRPTRRI